MERVAVITGFKGYIGGRLSAHLEKHGWKVHGLDKDNDTSLTGLVAFFGEIRPAMVFHLAAHFVPHHQTSDVDGLIESNLAFGTRLLEAIKVTGGGNLVVTGTYWQHFAGEPYMPVSLYAATKQAFQDLLVFYSQFENIRATVLKFFDTYGPGDSRKKLFYWFKEAAGAKIPVGMSPGEQLIDLVYIDDVVDALEHAANRLLDGSDTGKVSPTGGYMVSAGKALSLKQVAAVYGRVVGKPMNIDFGAKPYRPREMMEHWKVPPTLPGWKPKISLEEGIRRMTKTD